MGLELHLNSTYTAIQVALNPYPHPHANMSDYPNHQHEYLLTHSHSPSLYLQMRWYGGLIIEELLMEDWDWIRPFYWDEMDIASIIHTLEKWTGFLDYGLQVKKGLQG